MNLLHFKCEAGASRKSKWILMRKIMKLTFKPLNLSNILDIRVVLFRNGKRKIMCDKIIEGLVAIALREVDNRA